MFEHCQDTVPPGFHALKGSSYFLYEKASKIPGWRWPEVLFFAYCFIQRLALLALAVLVPVQVFCEDGHGGLCWWVVEQHHISKAVSTLSSWILLHSC